jgi:hypothetical protein
MASRAEPGLDTAFGEIEESILPTLSTMLEALIEAAALARSGEDQEAFAAEIRSLAVQLEKITLQVETVVGSHAGSQEDRPAPSASAA